METLARFPFDNARAENMGGSMNYKHWPKVYICPNCKTKSNALVCPKRKCLFAAKKEEQQ